MARSKKKKIVLDGTGTNLKEFQGKYAGVWRKIIEMPAYQAGVQFLRNRKLDSVANLSDEQIKQSSEQLLGDLRGFLQHENDMQSLSEMTDFKLPFEEPEVYLSPEQALETEKLVEKFQAENRKNRYA